MLTAGEADSCVLSKNKGTVAGRGCRVDRLRGWVLRNLKTLSSSYPIKKFQQNQAPRSLQSGMMNFMLCWSSVKRSGVMQNEVIA